MLWGFCATQWPKPFSTPTRHNEDTKALESVAAGGRRFFNTHMRTEFEVGFDLEQIERQIATKGTDKKEKISVS